MNFKDLFAMSPVNKSAARVISQRGVTEDAPLTKQDLAEISDRLLRKQRLLRLTLGIKNISQDRNMKRKARLHIPTARGAKNPRAMDEYIRIGPITQTIQKELAERKRKHLEKTAQQ